MTLKNYCFSLFVFIFLCTTDVLGQDIHFSQYYASPLNLNPALTGQFDGDYRIVGNYRNQWNSITTPYRTYSFSADARNVLGQRNMHGGVAVFSDEAGDSDFGTLQFGISLGYSYAMNRDSSHVLTFGVQPAYAQRTINYDQLTFDNQYSIQQGKFDPSSSNMETFQDNNRSYYNMAAGVSWDYRISKTAKLTAGVGVHNLTKPKQTLFSDDDVRLNRRSTSHINAQVRLNSQIELLPGFSLMKQGGYREIVFGSSGRYLLNGLTSLHLGYWYRNQDAGFITSGITHQNLYMGFSYDFNTSDLKPATNGRGGMELSIIYIFRKFNGRIEKYKACPNYL